MQNSSQFLPDFGQLQARPWKFHFSITPPPHFVLNFLYPWIFPFPNCMNTMHSKTTNPPINRPHKAHLIACPVISSRHVLFNSLIDKPSIVALPRQSLQVSGTKKCTKFFCQVVISIGKKPLFVCNMFLCKPAWVIVQLQIWNVPFMVWTSIYCLLPPRSLSLFLPCFLHDSPPLIFLLHHFLHIPLPQPLCSSAVFSSNYFNLAL